MSLFPRTPGTPGFESRNCPEIVLGGVPGLWELITPDCGVWSRRGLNQTCSPRLDLSNDVSHFQFGGREEVDSRLLVVGSQTASLTPGPSFAHNLGCRCPSGQCEAIFDIYASKPFQWHQEHLNARCFGPCCRTLNIRESRRTPNPQLWKCWASPPHLAKVGLRQPIWLPALLSTITHAADVQMTHARPFWTCTLQDLSNGIKNTSRQGVLTPAIELWVFRSPGGLSSPIFGSVSGDLTPPSKWGCDNQGLVGRINPLLRTICFWAYPLFFYLYCSSFNSC
jgi:hypothetical protein